MRWSEHFDFALSQPETDLAHAPHIAHSVTNQNSGVPFVDNFLHSIEALFLKYGISDRQHFVKNDNLRIQMSGDGKCQSNIHPAGIILHRHVNESLQSGELDDLIEPVADLLPRKAQHGTVQVDIIPTRKFRMKAGPDLEKACQASVHLDSSGSRLRDPRQDLEKSRFACSIFA